MDATTLTNNSVSVNSPWGGGSPRFSHQHSMAAPKMKGVITNSVMEQLRPPDTGGGATSCKDEMGQGVARGVGVMTSASGAVTVINVGASCADSLHSDDGKNIKYYQTCNGSVVSEQECAVIKEEDDEDEGSGSDGEVSKIDFTGVNLRNKKKRAAMGGEESRDSYVEEPERPMSWEGELSDAEMSVVTGSLDNKQDNAEREETSMEGVQICGVNNINNSTMLNNIEDSKHPLKFRENVVDKVLEHVRTKKFHHQAPLPPNGTTELPLLVDKLLGNGGCYITTPSHSPVLQHRHPLHLKHSIPPTPSPDSAIHSAYSYSSPTQSPVTSRHGSVTGFSSPYTPSLSRNNSDASQYGGSQHSSCYSYSSVSVSPTQFSPTHSPIQSRHTHAGFPSPVMPRGSDCSPLHVMAANGHVYGVSRGPLVAVDEALLLDGASTDTNDERDGSEDKLSSLSSELGQHSGLVAPPGISRQQLINSPCPICGDKISGFHYGIFSCESCKGFFKRTVQNRKNYVCLRGSSCPVTIATRKKCPACRFEKCLKMGMKLEAIREDRTRGGRSTYQCSYTLPASLAAPPGGGDQGHKMFAPSGDPQVKLEAPDLGAIAGTSSDGQSLHSRHSDKIAVPQLLQEIMDVEHLWHYNESEAGKMSSAHGTGHHANANGSGPSNGATNGPSNGNTSRRDNPDFLSNLCNIADHRLYRLVKWCKSLPLFKNISIDDQISLLINAWCELLLFSCCFRSMSTPGEIRVSLGKSISLQQARDLGLGACIERMLNFTEHLRRLRVDKYEYVAMKVIVLLTSDANDLRECEKVRASQEKALEALQHYTLAHYPDLPSKFGELLLRIPELQRTCQVGKEMLSIKNKEGEGPSFNLLMELLRGDH